MKSSSSSFRSLITNSLAKFCKNKIRVPRKKGQDLLSIAQATHQEVLALKILRNDKNKWFGREKKNMTRDFLKNG